jgi:hypothetical protein
MTQNFIQQQGLGVPGVYSRLQTWTIALIVVVALGGCSTDDNGNVADAASGDVGSDAEADQVVGTFNISLIAPTAVEPDGHTLLVGKVYDGPTPSQLIWEPKIEADICRLSTPRVPFCAESCGGSAVCTEDDSCQPYPTAHSVGKVLVTGVKTTSGANTFSMDPVAKTYQPMAGVKLPFPAFTEGDAIRLDAAGGDFSPFSLTARGVAPLELSEDKLELQPGRAIQLMWSPPGVSGISRIHVKLDISHHGGTKGMIECDTDDRGTLSIADNLVTALLDLGVAGYPTIIVTRHSEGSRRIAPGNVSLTVSSVVEREVKVPGLYSCTGDVECPAGQKCQSDLSCK